MTAAAPIDLATAHRILARADLVAWLDHQLSLPAEGPTVAAGIDELLIPIRYAACPGEQILDERRPPLTLRQSQAERWRLGEFRPGLRIAPAERERPRLELTLATLLRRTAAEAQLRERLGEFRHDHFNVAF